MIKLITQRNFEVDFSEKDFPISISGTNYQINKGKTGKMWISTKGINLERVKKTFNYFVSEEKIKVSN